MNPSPVQAPDVPADPTQGGPGPGGGFVSPAPPVEDAQASMALRSTLDIVSTSRRLAASYPQVTPEVQQINDLVAKMMAKIKGGQQRPESQAPPV